MPHGISRHNQGALVHDVEVTGSHLRLQVAQLHGADGVLGEAHTDGVGEVAVIPGIGLLVLVVVVAVALKCSPVCQRHLKRLSQNGCSRNHDSATLSIRYK